ncbi:DUF3604 domain-containing protein [Robertkochia flava]|uniref:DUF3604 domain-containing protein n=1 Tax=Robertkochia flava TaxID=3447986 RepID=UPI001CCB3257|nr:DUF3604 domain-containing protein [Robertkochia marina]
MKIFYVALVIALCPLMLTGQEIRPTKEEMPEKDKNYSPYVDQHFPTEIFWGDTHLHTSYSTDAGMAGNTVGPEDAYRFAMGHTITTSTGQKARLKRPLDFLVVADHAENLGLAPFLNEGDPTVLATEQGKKWYDMMQAGNGYDAFIEWVAMMNDGEDLIDNPDMQRTAWEQIIGFAEQYNNPGVFTTIHGFEWTSAPNGNNLHRNVLFRDGADRVKQVVPMSLYDSEDPEDLWEYMKNYEEKTGGRALAIPHNGNLSNGMMFMLETMDGQPFDANYAKMRARYEPVLEVTQPKGTGEAHPLLSPDDEFADFEIIDKGNLSGREPKTPEMIRTEYARRALMDGLVLENKLGANPFKFGMVGSTDAHGGLASTSEENWWGKANIVEPSPERFEDVLIKSPVSEDLDIKAIDLGASGLAAAWARENTREAIWDAFRRREVYGTTGSRIKVRVFAGWDFKEGEEHLPNFAEEGYKRGVPMGGDLKAASSGKAPTFLIRALRDPDGANLDRIQVVKGFVENGEAKEKIYNVALSDGRKVKSNGKADPVGNTVDVKNATWTNSIGEPLLTAFWKDPDFDPGQRAFYYIRVIEIPRPRWTAYDTKFYGVKMPSETKMTVQDRAYTSPIWYTPE